MSLEDVQNFFYHLCFDESFSLDLKNLEKIVAPEIAKNILSQDEDRQGVYRKLVYNNISDVTESALPCFFSFHTPEETQNLFRSFLAQYKPRTNFYRQVPNDFINFLKVSDFNKKQKHPFLLQLADYEFCEYDLLYQKGPQEIPQSLPDIALEEARLFLNPNLYLRDYDFDVTQIDADTDPKQVIKEKTRVLIYRDVNDQKIHFFTLNPMSASFLEIILNDPECPFAQVLANLKKIHSQYSGETIAHDALAFLKELMEKQIVLALV